MINHNNQVGQNQQYRSAQRLIIANVNNKREMMGDGQSGRMPREVYDWENDEYPPQRY